MRKCVAIVTGQGVARRRRQRLINIARGRSEGKGKAGPGDCLLRLLAEALRRAVRIAVAPRPVSTKPDNEVGGDLDLSSLLRRRKAPQRAMRVTVRPYPHPRIDEGADALFLEIEVLPAGQLA